QKKQPAQSFRKKRNNSNYVRYATKGFYVPVTGRITSKYGYRVHPVTKRRHSMHTGIDIAAPKGTPVKAAASGIIKRTRYSGGYGKLIIVQHEKDLVTYYGHLSAYRVRPGQRVTKGQIIGRVGTSGRSTGPHLHFEVRRGGHPLNPNSFIR
ncbi:MAG: M23 family metallopeptidase, partial [Bacteroidales bacterium]|nr:M23 family metallopeptidase [Bacteroidales bacterium]